MALARSAHSCCGCCRFSGALRGSIVTATNPYLQGLNAALAGRLLGLPYAVIITRDYDWDWAVLGKQAFGSVYPVATARTRGRPLGAAPRRPGAGRSSSTTAISPCATARRPSARWPRACWRTPPMRRATRVPTHDARSATAWALVRCLRTWVGSTPTSSRSTWSNAWPASTSASRRAARVRGHGRAGRLRCAQRAARAGRCETCSLLGQSDLADLPALLASSDVVVAPHMGYTLIEAGLTGVPIVTYDYDFHAEIVADGADRLLAPLRDVAALAERVCQRARRPGARRERWARACASTAARAQPGGRGAAVPPGIRPGAGARPHDDGLRRPATARAQRAHRLVDALNAAHGLRRGAGVLAGHARPGAGAPGRLAVDELVRRGRRARHPRRRLERGGTPTVTGGAGRAAGAGRRERAADHGRAVSARPAWCSSSRSSSCCARIFPERLQEQAIGTAGIRAGPLQPLDPPLPRRARSCWPARRSSC